MLGKATRGRQCLQMLSDISGMTEKALKREAEDGQMAEEIVINLSFARRLKEDQIANM